jgi:predicted DNA-binding transcriptional regulator AlpA
MSDPFDDTKIVLNPAAIPEAAHLEARSRTRRSRTLVLEPLLVSAPDAAHVLSISEATFWRWDSSGELGPRGIKKGGRRLWLLSELREWTQAGMPSRSQWEAMRSAGRRSHG